MKVNEESADKVGIRIRNSDSESGKDLNCEIMTIDQSIQLHYPMESPIAIPAIFA